MLPIAYIPVLFLAASVPGTEYLECVDLFNFAKKNALQKILQYFHFTGEETEVSGD